MQVQHNGVKWAALSLSLLITAAAAPRAAGEEEAADNASAKRPNILWITSEDNGPYLGCYGCADARTPNLDRLAAHGILYQNAFAAAPVCAPCRCSIITGMYATSLGTQHMRSTNFVPPDHVQFFVKHLRDAGYYCTNNSKTDYNLSPVQKEAWDEMTQGDHRRRKPGQPFFAVYNLTTSHESSLHKPVDKKLSDAKVTLPPYHPDTPQIRANWAMYHQVVSRMDAQVGEILQRLEEEGVADETIVFYYSDHGGILPRSKRFLYDTGVRVPLIVRFGKNVQHLDARQPGSKTDELVSFVDLAPTVLSLAGVAIPDYMQGQPFLGTAARERKPREYVYCFRDRMDERYDMSRAVRDKRFKYIRNYYPHRIYGQHLDYLWKMPATVSWEAAYRGGQCNAAQSRFWQPKPAEELYDTQQDPWEVNDLAGDPEFKDVLERMRTAHREHLLRICDAGFWPEAEMVAQAAKEKTSIYALLRDTDKYPLEAVLAAADLATRDAEGDAREIAALVELLGDDHPAVRYWGATGLAIRGQKATAAKDALMAAAKRDGSPSVRIAAAEALIGLGQSEEPLAVLTEWLAGEDDWAALHSANVLESIGAKAHPALPQLERAAQSRGEYIQRAAGFTAGRLKKPQ